MSSLSTQSDSQDLFGRGGAIQHITSGETGLIFQENSIRKITYVGPPLVFRIDEVERDRGLYAPNSVIHAGQFVYYYSHDGFFLKAGDGPSIPIGAEKVDRFFNSDLNKNQIDRMKGALDRNNKIVLWCYPSVELGRNRIIYYRWDIKKWGLSDHNATYVLDLSTPAYSLDDLDLLLPGSTDDHDISIDAVDFSGGVVRAAAVDENNVLSGFIGQPLPAMIETTELGSSGFINVKSVRCISDGEAVVSVGTRVNQNDDFSYSLPVAENGKGEHDLRTSTRYHRFRVSLTGGFNQAQGLKVFYRESGRR